MNAALVLSTDFDRANGHTMEDICSALKTQTFKVKEECSQEDFQSTAAPNE